MALGRIFAIRIAMGLIVAWAVLTLVFAMFTLTEDWVLQAELGILRFGGADEELLDMVQQQYFDARGLDAPLWEVYIDWMGNLLLLNWGDSFVTGEPARQLVFESLIRTGMYVLPAFVMAVVLGVGIGLVEALYPAHRLPRAVIIAGYLAFALPMFWVASIVVSVPLFTDEIYEPTWFHRHGLPIALVTASLLGSYLSYARAHSLEYVRTDFIKLVRAKGASQRLIGRHVLRNAAIPFFSMLFTEVILLLLLAVFVLEAVLGIDGFGLLILEATQERDLPVLLGSLMVVIAIGVSANILQDISYSYFDPRVDTGTR